MGVPRYCDFCVFARGGVLCESYTGDYGCGYGETDGGYGGCVHGGGCEALMGYVSVVVGGVFAVLLYWCARYVLLGAVVQRIHRGDKADEGYSGYCELFCELCG